MPAASPASCAAPIPVVSNSLARWMARPPRSASVCSSSSLRARPPSTRSGAAPRPAASQRSTQRCATPSTAARTTWAALLPRVSPPRRPRACVVEVGRSEALQGGDEDHTLGIAHLPRDAVERGGVGQETDSPPATPPPRPRCGRSTRRSTAWRIPARRQRASAWAPGPGSWKVHRRCAPRASPPCRA